ncbi:nuclear transport factor 2 family protein [Chitinasiproducens palmae]|uniref:SnoaL-like domain-containing protein n=1 Tax=Chitinasiproducens palmae TaxID=1770053 RepID=A0A1H2PKJ3_9BURK|nr:nuclear transport factor 2 family protein [Chitinasiproducens palmae]SDV46982.1 SnoaL-like domain-containing protein [Chitinasiproducens palmae]
MNSSIENLAARLSRLEAESEVRRLFTRYMQLCDVPQQEADFAMQLRALFTGDAVWEGVGDFYADKFGRNEGADQIVAMLLRYLPPTAHFVVNAHLLGSEHIEVDTDASRAVGRWIMQQTSIYVDRAPQTIIARLRIGFAIDAASKSMPDAGTPPQWRITHFQTERMLDANFDAVPRTNLQHVQEPRS